jgi:hypothetical protein
MFIVTIELNTLVPEYRLNNSLLTPLSSLIIADVLLTLRPEM